MGRSLVRSRSAKAAAAVTAGAAAVLAFSASAPATASADALPKPVPASAGHLLVSGLTAPLPTSQCVALLRSHIHCYTPLQYRAAYNLNPLYQHGITGKGRTIVIVDSFGSPTIQHDLNVFDKQFGLPNTTVTVKKWGNVPTFNPNDPSQNGWAGETTLDVEYAHAIAPGAKILLVETGVAETEGTTGFPEMMAAEQWAVLHTNGDVISQSFGATENTFPDFGMNGTQSLQKLRYAFAEAYKNHVTVLGASGDQGATDAMLDGNTLYKHPVNSWPSSDPLVTSVGGTELTLNDKGARVRPDVVWNDGFGAGGGGLSSVFARPGFQNGVARVTGAHRGTPDISMSAAVNGAAWVYSSYDPKHVGWGLTGGTSEATPIFSGIVALADQKAGHRLGYINPKLYALAESHASAHGIVDVTSGNNSFSGVKGYIAGKGYDLASGWGTINGTLFVDALAQR
jgi:subtilase family serine protease